MSPKRQLATEFTEGSENCDELMFSAEHLGDDPMASTIVPFPRALRAVAPLNFSGKTAHDGGYPG